MTAKPSIDIEIVGSVDRMDDGWFKAKIAGIGITGYGTTVEDARADAMNVFAALVSHLDSIGGSTAVKARLDETGIHWNEPGVGTWQAVTRLSSTNGKPQLAAAI